jgi:hypothetical protein
MMQSRAAAGHSPRSELMLASLLQLLAGEIAGVNEVSHPPAPVDRAALPVPARPEVHREQAGPGRLGAVGVTIGAAVNTVAERRVRGALERTYVLHVAAANIGADELAVMSADEHRQMFITFVAGLVGDFDSYLAGGDIDLVRDKVRYRLADLWLTDAELHEMAAELTAVIVPRLKNTRGSGRSRRVLRTFLLPGGEPGEDRDAPTGPDRPGSAS